MNTKKLLSIVLTFMLAGSNLSLTQAAQPVLRDGGHGGAEIHDATAGLTEIRGGGTDMAKLVIEANTCINWDVLNVDAGQKLYFNNGNNLVLNQVLPNQMSYFAGLIRADAGRIVISNPAGIVFSGGKFISNGPLTLTTNKLDITNLSEGQYKLAVPAADFQAGNIDIENSKIIAGGNVEIITQNGKDFVAVIGQPGEKAGSVNIENSLIKINNPEAITTSAEMLTLKIIGGVPVIVPENMDITGVLNIMASGEINITESTLDVSGDKVSLFSNTEINVGKVTVNGSLAAEVDGAAKITSGNGELKPLSGHSGVFIDIDERLVWLEAEYIKLKGIIDASNLVAHHGYSVQTLLAIFNYLGKDFLANWTMSTVFTSKQMADITAITGENGLFSGNTSNGGKGQSTFSGLRDLVVDIDKLDKIIKEMEILVKLQAIGNIKVTVYDISLASGLIDMHDVEIVNDLTVTGANSKLELVSAENAVINVKDGFVSAGDSIFYSSAGSEPIPLISKSVLDGITDNELITRISSQIDQVNLVIGKLNNDVGSRSSDAEVIDVIKGKLFTDGLNIAETLTLNSLASNMLLADNGKIAVGDDGINYGLNNGVWYVNGKDSGNFTTKNLAVNAVNEVSATDTSLAGYLALTGKSATASNTESAGLSVAATKGTDAKIINGKASDWAFAAGKNIEVSGGSDLTNAALTALINITVDNSIINGGLLSALNNVSILSDSTVKSALVLGKFIGVEDSKVEHSLLNARNITVEGASAITDSTLNAVKDIKVFGESEVAYSNLNAKEITVDGENEVTNSTLKAKDNITVLGKNKILVSTLKAGKNITVKSENAVAGSTLQADEDINVLGANAVCSSGLYAENILVAGANKIFDSALIANDLMKVFGKNKISSSYLIGNNITVKGINEILNGSILMATEKIKVLGMNTVDYSALYAENILVAGKNEVLSGSALTATKKINVIGANTVDNSALNAKNILVAGKNEVLSGSALTATKKINVIGANTVDDSTLKAGNILVAGKNEVVGSTLKAKKDIKVIGQNTVDNSTLKAGNILVAGKNEITNSALKAEANPARNTDNNVILKGENNVSDSELIARNNVKVSGGVIANSDASAGNNIFIKDATLSGTVSLDAGADIKIKNSLTENVTAIAEGNITARNVTSVQGGGKLDFTAFDIEIKDSNVRDVVASARNSIGIKDTASRDVDANAANTITVTLLDSAGNLNFTAGRIIDISETAAVNVTAIAQNALNASELTAENDIKLASDIMTLENVSAQNNMELVANNLDGANLSAKNFIARANVDNYANDYDTNPTIAKLNNVSAENTISVIAFDDNYFNTVSAENIDVINALYIWQAANVSGNISFSAQDLFQYSEGFTENPAGFAPHDYPARNYKYNVIDRIIEPRVIVVDLEQEKWQKEEEDEWIDHRPQVKQEVAFNLIEPIVDVRADFVRRVVSPDGTKAFPTTPSGNMMKERGLYIFESFSAR